MVLGNYPLGRELEISLTPRRGLKRRLIQISLLSPNSPALPEPCPRPRRSSALQYLMPPGHRDTTAPRNRRCRGQGSSGVPDSNGPGNPFPRKDEIANAKRPAEKSNPYMLDRQPSPGRRHFSHWWRLSRILPYTDLMRALPLRFLLYSSNF